jgi:uncharacterized membrane protein YcaP (DUF421 family)
LEFIGNFQLTIEGRNNMKYIKDKQWLLNNLQHRNISLQDVMVALITPEGQLYIDKRDDQLSINK